jgi:chromosome segregation ATPase
MMRLMAHPPDLEARVAALETRVSELGERVRRSEQDAAAARVLAGGADRDVADIRTEIREFRGHNTTVLNAMREDLTDVRQDLTNMHLELTSLRSRVDDGFIEIRGRLDMAAAGVQQIAGLLNTLISRGEGQ